MTRDQWERFVRAQVERFPPDQIDVIGTRALGRSVWCWSSLTRAELQRVYGAARAVALIFSM